MGNHHAEEDLEDAGLRPRGVDVYDRVNPTPKQGVDDFKKTLTKEYNDLMSEEATELNQRHAAITLQELGALRKLLQRIIN